MLLSLKASCFLDSPDWGETRGIGGGGVGRVKLMEGKVHQSHTHTHTRARAYARTHALMGPNNHSVMVECVCVTDRQVRGLLVTWLSAELCHSYLLWPLTSIPPQLLCAPLWCIYTNANAQATEGKEVRQCEKISKQNHLFWFNDTM